MRYCLIILCLFFISCEEKLNLQVDFQGQDILVIDCLITNEFKYHQLKLTRLKNSPNAPENGVSGAYITVTFGNTTVGFLESESDKGLYILAIPFGAAINETYRLNIDYKGMRYHANASMVPLYQSDTLRISSSDSAGMYYVVPPEEYNPQEAAMYEILVREPSISDTWTSKFYYFSLSTIDISQIFADKSKYVTFSDQAIVVQRKYSLSDEHEEFIRTMLLETKWRGNAFDVESANVFTNMSEGAVGFFGVSTVREIKLKGNTVK